jgi:hypothetical protein
MYMYMGMGMGMGMSRRSKFFKAFMPLLLLFGLNVAVGVYHLGLTTAPGRQLTGEKIQDQGDSIAFLASNYCDGKEIMK